MTSRWQNVEAAPADPILGLSLAYKADEAPNKINVGIGAYRDNDGKPKVLDSVIEAEKMIVANGMDKEYCPIDGTPEFRKASARLAFGDHACLPRTMTVQTLSGTGALCLTASWMQQKGGPSTLYVSDPSWGNHAKVFGACGIDVKKYRYFDHTTNKVNITNMIEDLRAMPEGSAVLLHACAHNPTGADPSHEQWKEIASVCVEKKLLPIMDSAYQGYATGDIDYDGYAVRLMATEVPEMFVTQSFAKNMGLYGERVGALHMVCASLEVAANCLSQMKLIIRVMYSSPPIHGARIVVNILNTPALFEQWKKEVKSMADRILEMRALLYKTLVDSKCPGTWTHITEQIGMFTFTGLNPAQVQLMREKHHIYMTGDGRISMAGLNTHNTPTFAAAVLDVCTNASL